MKKIFLDTEVDILDIEFPNKGIGEFDGKKVYVKNTLPGQKVKLNIKKKKQKFEGRLIEILNKAAYEINPDCSVFGICGGCTYRNISYEKELTIKKDTVLKLLSQSNIKDYEFLGIVPSPSLYSYRNKMEFSFGDNGQLGNLSLGMKKRGSYYEVAYCNNCKLISSDMQNILNTVLDFFKNTNETFYHKNKKEGSLRHLLLREGKFTGEILVGIVTTSTLSTDLTLLKQHLLKLNLTGKIVGIVHIINDSISDVVKADSINIIFGRDYIYDKLLGLKFKISLFSFFQTNSEGAEVLYSVVKDFIGKEKNTTIFDLYCGTGTISQILSQNFNNVYGIDIVDEAILSAKENCTINNIDNCNFIAGDVYKSLDFINCKPDVLVLDPPREGITPKSIKKIIALNSPKIVYISCKASSLSKDLLEFLKSGYKIEKIKLVDMFPKTYHVETVCLLTRN